MSIAYGMHLWMMLSSIRNYVLRAWFQEITKYRDPIWLMEKLRMEDLSRLKECRSRAMEMLENPELFYEPSKLQGMSRILKIWRYPSFSEHQVWAVYQRTLRSSRKEYILLTTVWDRIADTKRFGDPLTGVREGFHTEPTITFQETALPSSTVEELIDKLEASKVPAFAKDERIGLDGTRYGIELRYYMCLTRLRWWCDGPKEWAAIVKAVQEMIEVFEEQGEG
jgi:hypothetical protein